MKESTGTLILLTKMNGNIGYKDMSMTLFMYMCVQGENCIDQDQAEKVFETIKNSLDRKFSIIIDLKGVSIMTVAFANICFGQLVGIFDYEFLRNELSFKNYDNQTAELISDVMKNAKEYFNK